VKKLNAGSLPRKLKEPPISVRAIGPSLGESNRNAGMLSAKLGAGAVTAFMLIYYLYAGFIAVIALAMNVMMTIGVLAMLGATLTLPGVAGLVLSVGMAVDANILINERIREEQDKGAGLRTAIRLGYERAFSAILDSNLTTFITSVILYWIASEEIKGFGLTLAAGVVLNLFTAVFVTRIFFEYMSMARIPGELLRFPAMVAAGVGALGGGLWALAHFLTRPEHRLESTSIGFGKLLVFAAVAVAALLILMNVGRAIHHAFRPDTNAKLPMLRLIGVPNVDWYGLRRGFYAMSLVLTIGGVAAFSMRDKNQLYDIEFLGGTAAQIDLRQPGSVKEPDLEKRLKLAADEMRVMADKIGGQSQVSVKGSEVTISTPGVPSSRMVEFVQAVLGDWLQSNGARATGGDQVTLAVKPEKAVSEATVRDGLKRVAAQVRAWATDLSDAQIQAVAALEPGAAAGGSFEIVSRVTSKDVVVSALLSSMNDIVDIPQQVSFQVMKDTRSGGAEYFAIRENDLAKVTGDPTLVADVSEWKGGVAVVVKDLNPPQTAESMEKRLKAMRLQPGFEQYGWRAMQVMGLKGAEGSPNLYREAVVVVSDENYPLEESSQSSEAWRSRLAEPEVKLVRDALARQTSLGKITQFAPQVAAESKQRAIIALVLSWLAIIIYLWFRFGKATWGAAAVIALVHDVCVAIGMVAISYYLAQTAIGKFLLIENFRIDLAMVAALLTVVGYSVNDTIIVFDRIRENRGRTEDIRPQLVNNSINQTLSRTILTVFTVLIVVLIMYIFGGRGIHGFMYAMLVGILTGTYSSVYVASPLLVAMYKRVAKPVRGGKPQPAMA
jgi:preprotein translocase SecF subunit